MSTTFDQIATRIIKEQELIIGPVAWQEAAQVQGLHVSAARDAVTVDNSGAGAPTIDQLVSRYERLFGRASREACKEAVAGLLADLSPADIPSSLRTI